MKSGVRLEDIAATKVNGLEVYVLEPRPWQHMVSVSFGWRTVDLLSEKELSGHKITNFLSHVLSYVGSWLKIYFTSKSLQKSPAMALHVCAIHR